MIYAFMGNTTNTTCVTTLIYCDGNILSGDTNYCLVGKAFVYILIYVLSTTYKYYDCHATVLPTTISHHHRLLPL